MTRSLIWGLTLWLLALSGCVIAPESDSELASRTTPVFFQGYAKIGDSPIVIKAMNWSSGQLEEIGTTRTQATPTILANKFGTNPDLFYWSVTLPVSSGTAQNARWKSVPCNDTNPQPVPPSGTGSTTSPICRQLFEAQIVASQPADNGFELWTLPQGGGRCLTDKVVTNHEDLVPSFISCSTRGALLRLVAGP